MNASEHSIMFKSKSGRHFGNFKNKDDDKTEIKQRRQDKRHAAFTNNRVIEPTPMKAREVPTGKNNATSEEVISNVSRQQAFRAKFKNYLQKKNQANEAKSKKKPFLSAVANGRLVVGATKKPEPKKKMVQKPIEVSQHETPKYSPINTRSKKLALLSPSQLPTPKRKSRSKRRASTDDSNDEVDVKPRRIIPVEPVQVKKTTVPKKTVTKVAVKKVAKPTSPKFVKPTTTKSNPVAQPIKKPAIANAKTNTVSATNTVKPVVPKKQLQKADQMKPSANKVKSALDGMAPKMPKKFEFKPAIFNDLVTSTVVKEKKMLPKVHIKKFMNQSISPIEDSTPNKVVSTQKAIPTPKGVMRTPAAAVLPRKDLPFVSPFVTIKASNLRQQMSNDAIQTPTEKNIVASVVRTPTNSEQIPSANLNYVSPYVTIARGARSSGRKEKNARNSKYTLDSRKSLDLNQSVERRQNQEAATYFRLQVQREIDQFNVLIKKWRLFADENGDTVPSEYIDLISVAIGQTQLLISSKFKQFTKLIGECENNDGEKEVKPEDLEGFWSMVYLQVENCNKRFERLDVLKKNNWEDPELKVVKKKKIRTENAMVTKNKPARKNMNSALSQMLKEAKKKYNESKGKQNEWSEGVVFVGNRKSLPSKSPHRNLTPKNTLNTVEDPTKTPVRSILKTPGSIRKQRMTLTFKRSPQVKVFEKGNFSTEGS